LILECTGDGIEGGRNLLSHKCATRSHLLGLLRNGVRSSTVENLQPIGDLRAHTVVHVSLGALDVIVEIVSEGLQEVDGLEDILGIQMVIEEDHRNETVAFHILQAREVLQFHGGFSVSELDGRHASHVLSSVSKLLQEDLGEHSISILREGNGEDDGAAVILGLQVDGLIATVINGDDLAVALLGSNICKDLLERSSEQMALQVADLQGEVLGILRGVGKVNTEGDVVTLLRGGLKHRTIDLLQILLTTQAQQLTGA